MSTLTVMSEQEERVREVSEYFASPRFKGIIRLYSPRQVVEQRGTIGTDYPIARKAAEGFYARLRELFAVGKSITTFGPYSPGQAVTIKRNGIEGIYLGGWATSAKGSITEDPGADLASYPLEPGARRGGSDRARAADRRSQPALLPLAHDGRAARRCARTRLSGRSSLPTPTPDTAATRTCAT